MKSFLFGIYPGDLAAEPYLDSVLLVKTFGIDPDPNRVKVLRIYARGPNGGEQMFEYREGSTVDGSQFRGWGRGDWGTGGWSGRWEAVVGRGARDDRHERDQRAGDLRALRATREGRAHRDRRADEDEGLLREHAREERDRTEREARPGDRAGPGRERDGDEGDAEPGEEIRAPCDPHPSLSRQGMGGGG